MLERFTARARHIAIALLASIAAYGVQWLGTHQDDATVWVGAHLHLPVLVLPLIPTVLAWLLLEVTPLTRQYGVGAPSADDQPTAPAVDPTNVVTVPAPVQAAPTDPEQPAAGVPPTA